jgi:uncharacterized protein YrzB (UPF0473 family)
MMDNENMFYTLIDDDGVEQEFELLDKMEYEGATYYAMCMLTEDYDDEEEAEFDVLKSETDAEGEEILVTLEDEELRSKIGELFAEKLNAESE